MRTVLLSLGIAFVLFTGSALAGNGWNPPTQDPAEEKRLRKVGTEFFKLSGQLYLLLAAIDEGDLPRAKTAANVANEQVSISSGQCVELRKYLAGKAAIATAYQGFSRDFEKRTVTLVNARVVPPGDPAWTFMSKVGSENLPGLCERAVGEIKEALRPIAEKLPGEAPTRVAVWRLMNAVENGSKQSRYFSIALSP